MSKETVVLNRNYMDKRSGSYDDLIELAQAYPNKRILILHAMEWAPYFVYYGDDNNTAKQKYQKIKEAFDQAGSELVWIWGAGDFSLDTVMHDYKSEEMTQQRTHSRAETLLESISRDKRDRLFIEEIFESYDWSLFFLNDVVNSIYHHFSGIDSDYFDKVLNTPRTKAFSYLVRGPWWHRQVFMDLLAKYNMIDNGVVAWNQTNEFLNWRYWDAHEMNLDAVIGKDDQGEYNHSFMLLKDKSYFCYSTQPEQVLSAFMDVIPESNSVCNFYTEKTFKSIMRCRPFLIVAGPGIHEKLFSYGFKPYEIFDYSFDSIKDPFKRNEMLINEVIKIHNMGNFDELYKSILPTIKHNFYTMLDLYENNSFCLDELTHAIKNEKFIEFSDDEKMYYRTTFNKKPGVAARQFVEDQFFRKFD